MAAMAMMVSFILRLVVVMWLGFAVVMMVAVGVVGVGERLVFRIREEHKEERGERLI